MEKNKVYAKLKNNEWWAVIDCGPTREGGMTVGNFWATHFKYGGRTFRWYRKLFMPPELKEWQEINVLVKEVAVVDVEGNVFEGWKDEEDLAFKTLSNFASLIGKPMSIDEIKNAIVNAQ